MVNKHYLYAKKHFFFFKVIFSIILFKEKPEYEHSIDDWTVTSSRKLTEPITYSTQHTEVPPSQDYPVPAERISRQSSGTVSQTYRMDTASAKPFVQSRPITVDTTQHDYKQ